MVLWRVNLKLMLEVSLAFESSHPPLPEMSLFRVLPSNTFSASKPDHGFGRDSPGPANIADFAFST